MFSFIKKTYFLKVLLALLFISLLALFILQVQNLQLSGQLTWVSEDHKLMKVAKFTEENFSEYEDVIININLGESYFQSHIIEQVQKLTEQLKKSEYIHDVITPLNVKDVIHHDDDISINTYQNFLDENQIFSLSDYEKKITDSFYHNFLISQDTQYINIIVLSQIKTTNCLFGEDKEICDQVRKEVLEIVEKELESFLLFQDNILLGRIFINHMLSSTIVEDLAFMLPTMLLLLIMIMYIIFRSFLKSILIILTVTLCLLSSLSVLTWLDLSYTPLSVLLSVIIIVVAITDSIHILLRWEKLKYHFSDKLQHIKATLKETWFPCFFTSLTTALGMASFLFSDLVVMQDLAISAIYSIALSYCLILLSCSILLYLFYDFFYKDYQGFFRTQLQVHNIILYLYHQLIRYKTYFVSIALVLLVAVFWAIPYIKVEINILNVFFKSDNPVHQRYAVFNEHFEISNGLTKILIEQEDATFNEFEHIQILDSLISKIKSHEAVYSVHSFLDPLSMLHEVLADDGTSLPSDQKMLDQEVLLLEFARSSEEQDLVTKYIDFDYQNTKVDIYTSQLSSDALIVWLDDLKKLVTETVPENYKVTFYGLQPFYYLISTLLLEAQLVSIVLTVSLLLVLFILLFGFRLGIIGLITNLVPVAMTFLGMVIFNISLDVSTLMICAISLSIAVDDTIHCLHYFKSHHKKENETIASSIIHMLTSLSRPLFYTSVLLCTSFFILVFSEVVMLQKFGGVTSVSIIFAFISNIVLLPSLLHLFYKNSSEKKQIV